MTRWMWIIFILILAWCVSRTITAAKIFADNIEARNKKKEDKKEEEEKNNEEEWKQYWKNVHKAQEEFNKSWRRIKVRMPEWKCPEWIWPMWWEND